jgi:hypothetical protein
MLDSVKNDRSRGLVMRPTCAWLTDGASAWLGVADGGDVAAVVADVAGDWERKEKKF